MFEKVDMSEEDTHPRRQHLGWAWKVQACEKEVERIWMPQSVQHSSRGKSDRDENWDSK